MEIRSSSLKSKGMTFEEWMRRVDNVLSSMVGVESADLVDVAWMDEYEADQTPREAIEYHADALGIAEFV